METNHEEQQEQEIQTRKDIEARIIAKAWKDEAYKQELLTNPKAVFAREFGVEFREEATIQVTQENPTSLYLVLPTLPEIEGVEFSEEELELIAGGKRGVRDYRDNKLIKYKPPMGTGKELTSEIVKDGTKVIAGGLLVGGTIKIG